MWYFVVYNGCFSFGIVDVKSHKKKACNQRSFRWVCFTRGQTTNCQSKYTVHNYMYKQVHMTMQMNMTLFISLWMSGWYIRMALSTPLNVVTVILSPQWMILFQIWFGWFQMWCMTLIRWGHTLLWLADINFSFLGIAVQVGVCIPSTCATANFMLYLW